MIASDKISGSSFVLRRQAFVRDLVHVDNLPLSEHLGYPWAGIFALSMDEPPENGQYHNADKNDRVVIHRLHNGWVHEGKAIYDVEEDDEQERKRVHCMTDSAVTHPEWTFWHIPTAGEKMRGDGQAERHGGQNDEGANQIAEGSLAAKLDGAECCAQNGAKKRCWDRAREPFVYGREKRRERRGVIAS